MPCILGRPTMTAFGGRADVACQGLSGPLVANFSHREADGGEPSTASMSKQHRKWPSWQNSHPMKCWIRLMAGSVGGGVIIPPMPTCGPSDGIGRGRKRRSRRCWPLADFASVCHLPHGLWLLCPNASAWMQGQCITSKARRIHMSARGQQRTLATYRCHVCFQG